MGEMADDHAELAWAYEEELERLSKIDELLSKRRWLMKDGNYIAIKDMEVSHIHNCINKIVKDNWRTQFLDLFINELEKRKIN